MNKNEYDEIINGKETFKQIAQLMKENKSCIIGWTDEEYTHYDILFSKSVYKEFANYLQRGLRESDLYVSVIGIGAFGFKTDNLKEPGYIAEKLFGNRIDESVIMVSHLINGIIQEMMEK